MNRSCDVCRHFRDVDTAVALEFDRAVKIHGLFRSPREALRALQGEVDEVALSVAIGDMDGPHGYQSEMRQVAAVAIKSLVSHMLWGREIPMEEVRAVEQTTVENTPPRAPEAPAGELLTDAAAAQETRERMRKKVFIFIDGLTIG